MKYVHHTHTKIVCYDLSIMDTAFNIGDPQQLFSLDFLDSDSDEEKLLETIDFDQILSNRGEDASNPVAAEVTTSTGTSTDTTGTSTDTTGTSTDTTGTSSSDSGSITNSRTARFKTVTEEDVAHFYEANQSKATKTATKWGVRVIQGQHFFMHTPNIHEFIS